MSPRSSARITILVGVLILASTPALFPHAGQRECVTSVEPVADLENIDQTEIAGVPDVIQYEELSDGAKVVFDRARSRGEVTVHGPACPEQFHYTQYPATYAVEASGEHFRVVTEGDSSGWLILELLHPGSFLILGISFAALGYRATSRDEGVHPLPVVLLGAFAAVLFATRLEVLPVFPVSLLAIVVGSAAVGAFLPFRWALPGVIAGGTFLVGGFRALGWTGPRSDLLFATPLFAALGAAYRYRERWRFDDA